jgi:hypothetical protein
VEPDAPETRSSFRVLRASRAAVTIALVAVGYAVLVSDRWTVDHELQLVAPDHAAPGDPIPLRAFLFSDIATPEGAVLAPAHVSVELLDAAERVVARTLLARSPTDTSEGALAPVGAPGRYRLRAVARGDDGSVLATVERPIAIAQDAPPLPLSGRLAGELQHLQVLPVIVLAPDALAPHVHVRVQGGACVPEEPCTLWVAVSGADAVGLSEERGAATLVRSALEEGLHRVEIVARGPEVSIELLLRRQERDFALVPMRLPIALATPWLDAQAEGTTIRLEARPPPGRETMILDVYDRGRWIGTRTIDRRTRELDLGRTGLIRLQAHVDSFSAERAAARYVLAGVDPARARALLEAEGAQSEDPPATDLRLVLAGLEEELRALPAPSSGLEADRARMRARRERIQFVAGIALLLTIAVFVLTLLGRGLSAADEARRLLEEAGDTRAGRTTPKLRAILEVVAMVSAVAVGLLAGAALLLARAALDL